MATTAAAPTSCLRGNSQLLTRTWLLGPSYLHHRAAISTHTMNPLAYPIPAECPKNSIKRSLDPYRLSYAPNRTPASTRRSFHSTSRFARNADSAIPHISLHIAAASSGKGRKYAAEKSTIDFIPSQNNALGLQSQGSVYQRRRNRPDSGEDAYFVAAVGGDPTTIAMGVCDGVGGWQEQGINPSDFSHGLCSYMAQSALAWTGQHEKANQLHPKTLLDMGYDETLADSQIRAGGATACVAVADASGRLRTANLGDSGYIQLRLGSAHQYSDPQTHAFNTPYQMSKTPPEIMTQAAIFGGLPLNDAPDRADVADTQLLNGDVVVFATDGVWDNLSHQDILTIVSHHMRERGAWERTDDRGTIVTDRIATLVHPNVNDEQTKRWSLQSVLASHIVGEAKLASLDRKRDGPFARAVQREYPEDRWHGGKIDDITALVLIAVENKNAGDGQLKAKL